MEYDDKHMSIEQWSFAKDGESIRGILNNLTSTPLYNIFYDFEEKSDLTYVTTRPISKIKYIPKTKILRAYSSVNKTKFDLGYPNIYFILSTAKYLRNYHPMNDTLICKYLLKECQTQVRAEYQIIKNFDPDVESEDISDHDEDEDLFYESD